MTQPDEEMVEAGQPVTITVAILNSSSADLTLADGELTAGYWVGAAPVVGTILATGPTSFVNASQSALGEAGGYLTLVPAGGGTINMSWSWSSGQSLMAYGNISGTNALLLSYTVTGVATFHPTVTYVITDPGRAGERK